MKGKFVIMPLLVLMLLSLTQTVLAEKPKIQETDHLEIILDGYLMKVTNHTVIIMTGETDGLWKMTWHMETHLRIYDLETNELVAVGNIEANAIGLWAWQNLPSPELHTGQMIVHWEIRSEVIGFPESGDLRGHRVVLIRNEEIWKQSGWGEWPWPEEIPVPPP